MIWILVGIIIVLCILLYIVYNKRVAENTEIIQKNQEQEKRNERLVQEYQQASQDYIKISTQKDNALKEKNQLEEDAEKIHQRINRALDEEEQVKNTYDSSLKLIIERYQRRTNEEKEKFKSAKQSYQDEYLRFQEECVLDHISEIEELDTKLSSLKNMVRAAVEERKRAAAAESNRDFYRLQLSDADIEEIRKIRTILPYLRDKEPLNKVIYKTYYEKPYTDLIGRVIGSGTHTGIYKITNIQNGMCYVGQRVDLRRRWKQHIRRGVGADPPTQNKLYPAMLAIGVENFTFEVLQECEKTQLNELEDFWQDFYKAKEFGYSIK